MGHSLHVAKEFKVSFGTTNEFNWKCEEIHKLLRSLGVHICSELDEPDPHIFEVEVSEWEDALDSLKLLAGGSENEVQNWVEIIDSIDRLGRSTLDVLEIFERYDKEADKSSGNMLFCFF